MFLFFWGWGAFWVPLQRTLAAYEEDEDGGGVVGESSKPLLFLAPGHTRAQPNGALFLTACYVLMAEPGL